MHFENRVLRDQMPLPGNADHFNATITKTEYRRLTKQVRDVNHIIRNKYRTLSTGPAPSPLPKFPKPAAVASYESRNEDARSSSSHLDSSRLPFYVRRWLPLQHDSRPEGKAARGRPALYSRLLASRGSVTDASTKSATGLRGSRQDLHTSADRPLLTPIPPPPRLENAPMENSHFSALSSQIICSVLKEASYPPLSTPDGDWPGKGPEQTGKEKDKGDGCSSISISGDLSKVSGAESGGSSEGSAELSDEEDNEEGDTTDSDIRDLQLLLEDIQNQLPQPEKMFALPPEKVDVGSSFRGLGDARLSDFEASKPAVRSYEFKSPLPDCLCKINLRRCALEKRRWQDLVNSRYRLESEVKQLVNRLVELERMQLRTENWESRKAPGRHRRSEKGAPSNASSASSNSRHRDRKLLCHYCLQPSCQGDCCAWSRPESRQQKKSCVLRQDNQDCGEPQAAISSPPCSKSYSVFARGSKSRVTSARPKSSAAADSRGRALCPRPATAATAGSSLRNELEGLGLEVPQSLPPHKARSYLKQGRQA